MELIKEECMNALYYVKCADEQWETLYEGNTNNLDSKVAMLEQAINGYFELAEEIKLLKRENKALAADSELKCEKIEQLEKERDKACEMLHYEVGCCKTKSPIVHKDCKELKCLECWKEFLMQEVTENE